MQKVNLDPLSYTAFPIKIYDELGNQLAIATGFYYEVDKTLWLVTNLHNVTGYDYEKKSLKDTQGRTPQKIAVPIAKNEIDGIRWKWYIVDLYEEEKAKWLIHPTHGSKVDVVAIEMAENIPENVIKPINTIEWDKVIEPIVADNVYVLGFPYGLKGGGNFPLWKRATIASEPGIDYDSLPQFVIDTTTREGMSGSPVILRRSGIHNLLDGIVADDTIIGEVQNFIGIYSGRLWASESEETQLGRVWKASVIEEILKNK